MTCSGTHDPGACPCGIPHFPVVICNQANQPQILYRIGDYLAFRDRLLRAARGARLRRFREEAQIGRAHV